MEHEAKAMTENEKLILRHIRNLRPVIMQDGRIDMVETAWLLKTIRPDETSLGLELGAFAALLREVRADGVVTPEESARLVRMMDALLERADLLR